MHRLWCGRIDAAFQSAGDDKTARRAADLAITGQTAKNKIGFTCRAPKWQQHKAREADLVLGCLACDGQIGRAPRRFVIARALESNVDAASPKEMALAVPELATKTTFAPRPTPKLVAELAEPAAPAFVSPLPAKERPYLRLVRLQD